MASILDEIEGLTPAELRRSWMGPDPARRISMATVPPPRAPRRARSVGQTVEPPGKPNREPTARIELSLVFSDEAATGGWKYELLTEAARFADRNGFAAIWTPERHFHRFGGLYPIRPCSVPHSR